MARPKKQHLHQRPDGRYLCRYKGVCFYGDTEEEAFYKRDIYKEMERQKLLSIPTVKEYAETWFPVAYPKVTASTRLGLKIHLRKLTDSVGDLPLNEVKPLDIKTIYAEKYAYLSNSYITAGKQLFCAFFDSAVANGYCDRNPARDRTAKPHKGTMPTTRAITKQERIWIETLCTDHRAYPAVMTMLYAGLRPQEMKALVIDRDVDFENDIIRLRSFAHYNDKYGYAITKAGKTDKAVREIPLLPPLKAVLQGRKGYLITDAKGKRVNIQAWKCVWKSYVFSMETAINGCQKRWYGKKHEHKKYIAEGGKLPDWISFDIVPYDLRHSFCTMCRDNGVELNTCIHWMGHTDAKMIMKVYDEYNQDRGQKEAERLVKILETSQNASQNSGNEKSEE